MKSLVVLSPKDVGTTKFEVDGGVFVAVVKKDKSSAWGFWCFDGQAGSREFYKSIDTLIKESNFELKNFDVKIIGSAFCIELCEKFFKAKALEVSNKVLREGKFEVLFTPSVGRIQVSKIVEVKDAEAGPTRVLIVDDSQTIRQLLTKIFERDPGIKVVGMAERPSQVEDLIQKTKPHVITLDINMPEMDGVTLLRKYLPKYPIPTVMITALSKEDGTHVFDALESGAVDYIQKPTMGQLDESIPVFIEKIKSARDAKVQKSTPTLLSRVNLLGGRFDNSRILAIGSSTGGTEALREVFQMLPDQIPPTLVVQHIPPVFSKAFADRLNELLPFEVKEAEEGDEVRPNRVLIAAGGIHMKIAQKGGGYIVVMDSKTPLVNRFKPSVDVMFESVAEVVGKKAVGVILTGMGSDGAKGMLKMKEAGARTLAQDKASCVVFGMPQAAIKLGGVDEVVPLSKMAGAICQNLLINRKVG